MGEVGRIKQQRMNDKIGSSLYGFSSRKRLEY